MRLPRRSRPCLVLVALASLHGACDETPAVDPPDPDPDPEVETPFDCAAGFVERDDPPGCDPILPDGACPPGTMAKLGEETCQAVGPTACAAGFASRSGDWGCDPILPSAACASGTRPQLGAAACVPVGWQTCPSGFAPASSGWGCDAVVPAGDCVGATRVELGSGTCAPLGDCAAAPPATASLFVDDSFTAGELDATHFLTLGAAVAAASAGDTIFVEAGLYGESLTLDRDLTVVGRCAEQVVIEGSAAPAWPGVHLSGAPTVVLSDLTLSGHAGGVDMLGGTLTLTRVLLRDNQAVGASVGGGTAHLDEVIIRDTIDTGSGAPASALHVEGNAVVTVSRSWLVDNDLLGIGMIGPNAEVTVSDSIIAGTRGASTLGMGAYVTDGAHLVLTRVLLDRNARYGLAVVGSSAELTDLLAIGVAATGAAGLAAVEATLALDGVRLLTCPVAGIYASGATTEITANHLVIEATRPDAASGESNGLYVDAGATVELNDAVLYEQTHGLQVLDDGSEVVAGALLVESPTVEARNAAVVEAATLRLTDAHLGRHQRRGISAELGARVFVDGSSLVGGETPFIGYKGILARDDSRVELSGSLIDGVHGDALYAEGGGIFIVADSLLRDTNVVYDGVTPLSGVAIQLYDASFLIATNSEIRSAAQGGVGCTGAGSSAALTDVLIRDVAPASGLPYGTGLLANGGSSVTLSGCALLDNRDVGLWLANGAIASISDSLFSGAVSAQPGLGAGLVLLGGNQATVTGSSFESNTAAGIVVTEPDDQLTLDGSLVRGTVANPAGELGLGIANGGRLSVSDSALFELATVGLWVLLREPGGAATASVTGSLIASVSKQGKDDLYGHGLLVMEGASLELDASEVSASDGVGLVFAGGGGLIATSLVQENTVGVHAQDGSTLREIVAADGSTPSEANEALFADTTFYANETRVGVGSVPVLDLDAFVAPQL